MTNQRNDSMGSLLNGVAAARQFGQQLLAWGGTIGGRVAYSRGGLMARIIDLPAELATARGVTIEDGGPDVQSEMDRLSVLENLSDALRWSLLDGGGALIAMVKDGGELAAPINPNSLTEIEEFRVVSVLDIKAGPDTYSDPTQLNYGWPTTYEVKFKSGAQYVPVHESRIIEVPGAARLGGVDDIGRIPWAGQPIGGALIQAVERYRNGVKWAEKLLERSQQAVHRMKGLADMLMAQQESVVRARIDLVDSNRSAINGVAVDAEDDYTITSATMSGVKDTIEQLQVAVAAESGYPVTVLFGRSPGGLNATGDSDWDIVYQQVGQLQRRRLRQPLERIVSLIYAQKRYSGERPDNWRIVFNPLEVLNEQQTAEMENKKADTLNKVAAAVKTLVVDAGALSQDEASAYLRSERMFGLQPDEATGTGSAAAYAAQT